MIVFFAAVLAAAPAIAAQCQSPSGAFFRYVAPPESRYAGEAFRFYGDMDGDHYVSDDDEPLHYDIRKCEMGMCYFHLPGNEFAFAVMSHDAEGAIIRPVDEPAMRWQADCQ